MFQTARMHTTTLAPLSLLTQISTAQIFPVYVQFEGNSSGPTWHTSEETRSTLVQADSSPNASHTVSFKSPGDNSEWDWTLQISDASVPSISNSTPNAHVAYTTWHFSRTDEEPATPEDTRPNAAPVLPTCAYLLDVNPPYNVSTEWDPDSSSCVSALGADCVNSLSEITEKGNCASSNILNRSSDDDPCYGMFGGGPREYGGIGIQGYRTFPASIA